MKRDFLRLEDRSQSEYRALFDRAKVLKERRAHKMVDTTLAGRTLALLFEKASTRTRVSFEAAVSQLGGYAISLPFSESQLARGEPLSDTARVLSGYVDAVVMRTFADERLAEFARSSTVPVINGLTDGGHPVQVLADLFTVEERLGGVRGMTLAFVGDGASNMVRSFIEASRLFGFHLRVAAPEGYRPPRYDVERAKEWLTLTGRPEEAADGADVVITDVWTSMGQEKESAQRLKDFKGFCVDQALVKRAKPTAIVLHCLPAHRGEEISEEVMSSPQSAIFEEAENRLHVQKALLEQLMLG